MDQYVHEIGSTRFKISYPGAKYFLEYSQENGTVLSD
jgi:hypothetical protein